MITKIEILENGPILIHQENATPQALCRCGRSESKPFCDGRHKGEFTANGETVFEVANTCCDEGACCCCE